MTGGMAESDREFWESISQDWLDDFCAEGQDPWATDFNLPAFMELVPSPTGLTLDVGCGEGRVGRLLQAKGHQVIGIDGSPTLAHAAGTGGMPVAVADGGALPFRDAQASLAISSMVLMDVDDLHGQLCEIARVLTPGGALCLSVLHPIRLSGFPMDDEYGTFALGDYLGSQRLEWTASRNGEAARVRFWKRPVSEYVNALARAGFDTNRMREPRPSDDFVCEHAAGSMTRVPMFLHIAATRQLTD